MSADPLPPKPHPKPVPPTAPEPVPSPVPPPTNPIPVDGKSIAHPRKEERMSTLAREIMTVNPACCSPTTTLDEVAKMMVHNDCGEIPVVDTRDHVVGVITDRDIVCRVVAQGMNPTSHIADDYMTRPVVTVREDAPLEAVIETMEKHQIRRVPVVKDGGLCTGIISQADLARIAEDGQVAELLCEVSQHSGRPAQL